MKIPQEKARERPVNLPTVRHFLADDDINQHEQKEILRLALRLKKAPYSMRPLEGPQSVALLFDKTSTRTRFSFAAGIAALGGNTIVADSGASQMGKGETLEDTGAVLSRFTSLIVWRTYEHRRLEAMASTATVPIINALCDDYHPCQILADLLTCVEHITRDCDPDSLQGKKAAYVGDGANNMANSYLLGLTIAGMDVTIISPEGYQPAQAIVERARALSHTYGTTIEITSDLAAVADSDVVITDTWVSMGQEAESQKRLADLAGYTVTDEVMNCAGPQAKFLHCLPAYRGKEVTASVIDGNRSVVFDEAENRLHAQKALMVWLLEHQPTRPLGE